MFKKWHHVLGKKAQLPVGNRKTNIVPQSKYMSARVIVIIISCFFSGLACADVKIRCDEDMFSKTANKISVCISCDPSVTPADSVNQAAQKILSIVKQCQSLAIDLSGTISANDDLYLDEAAKLLNGKRKELGLEFSSFGYSIDSAGGDVATAIKMADLLYKNHAALSIERCYSACVIVISGATSRQLIIDVTDVRVHRIFPKSPDHETDFKSWSEREHQEYLVLASLFEKFGVSTNVLELMKVTPSSDVRSLSLSELESLGLGFKNVRYEEEVRFNITKHCGTAEYATYLNSGSPDRQKLLEKCAPELTDTK